MINVYFPRITPLRRLGGVHGTLRKMDERVPPCGLHGAFGVPPTEHVKSPGAR